mgnify:CR=1 FL=1
MSKRDDQERREGSKPSRQAWLCPFCDHESAWPERYVCSCGAEATFDNDGRLLYVTRSTLSIADGIEATTGRETAANTTPGEAE